MAIQLVSGMKLVGFATNSILKVDTNGILTTAVDGVDYNTSTSQWTNTNGGIYYSDSVRVGTYQAGVLPGAKLHVFDYQTTTPKFLIEDGNTGDASMEFKISTQSYTMGIDNSDSDKFVLAASTALGTTNVLEVATTGISAFQKSVLVKEGLYINANSTNGISFTDDGTYTAMNADAVLRINQRIEVWGGGSGKQYLDVRNQSGDVKIMLNAEDNSYFNNSKVGIGTTDPTKRLHIRHDGNAPTGLLIQNLLDNNGTNDGDAAAEVFLNAASNNAYFRVHGAPTDSAAEHEVEFGTTAGTSFFTFKPSGNERMRITNGGNVGIGTSDPTATLTVNGEIEILKDDYVSTSEGGHLTLRAGSAYSYRYNIDNNADIFRFFRQDDATGGNGLVFMEFDSSGNVQFNQYGAGLLKTDANGNVSLDTNTYLTSLPTHNHDTRYYTKTQSDTKYLTKGDSFIPISMTASDYEASAEEVVLSATNSYKGLAFPNGAKDFEFEVSIKGGTGANHQGIFWGATDLTSLIGAGLTGYKTTHQNADNLHIRDIANNSTQMTINPEFAPDDGQYHRYRLVQYRNSETDSAILKVYLDGNLIFDTSHGGFNNPPQQPTYFGFIVYTGDVKYAHWNVRDITDSEDLIRTIGEDVFQPVGNYLTSLPAHEHDARYYTETEMDTFLAGKLSTSGGSLSGQVIFPSAATTKPVLPNGFISRNDNNDTTGRHDIWGISERYYPSNSTAEDAWGIQWSGTPNDIVFVGGGEDKVTISLDEGNISTLGTISASGYNKTNWDTAHGWGNHADEGYLTSVPSEYLTQTEGDARYAGAGKGNSHTSFSDLNNNPTLLGWTYYTGTTNSPHNGNQGGYKLRVGLGSEYGTDTGASGHYAMEMLMPRTTQATSGVGYLYMRQMESGAWDNWSKVKAGYADSTPWSGITGKPTLATESYVTTAISNLVDSAPGALNTLNELAAALGDDANFSTTVTNNIGAIDTRINDEVIPYIASVETTANAALPKAGGTMTGTLRLPWLWSSTDLTANSFYVKGNSDQDGFAFGVGTGISSWFSWDNVAGQKRAIDVWNDGSKILLGAGGHDTEIQNNLHIPNAIHHTGDTNTYMQFHAGDQWRVVTGGTERLEVNNSATTVANLLTASGGINGLTLANGGISGSNYNITGVNQLEIADPGEGIVFKSGSSGDMTLAIVDDSSDNILRFSGTGATFDVAGSLSINGSTFVDSARGSINLNSSNAGAGNGIFFRDGFNYNASITVEDHNGSYPDGICISGYDGISFSTGSNDKNERMRITTAGKVGIGTTNPTTIFHAVGALNDGWGIFQRGTKQLYVNPNYSGTNVFAQLAPRNGDSMDLSLAGNDSRTDDIYIKHDTGNVGINTTNPTTKLYVDGGESTFNRGNSDGAIARFRGKNNEKAVIGTVDSWFGSRVGIGTSSPTTQLQVGATSTNSISPVASLGSAYAGILSALSLVNTTGNAAAGYGVAMDFHVNSGYSPTGRIATIAENTSTPAALAFYTYNGGLNKKMQISSDGSIRFHAYGAGLLKTDANGNISLDTSTYATATDLQALETYANATFLQSVPSTFSATAITLSGIKLEESSDRPGILEINRDGTNTYAGIMTKFSGTAEWALMGDETAFGLYDDQNNDWAWRYTENLNLVLYSDGVVRAATKSDGFQIKNTLELGALATTDQGILKLSGSTANKESILKTTNGNLHIDSADGHSLYLNFYTGTTDNIIFGNGNTGASGAKITSGGVVHATGGNSGNWNTAYGWGNHASAGYLTSYTETDTLASVTSRGASTTTSLSIRELTSRNIFPEADRTYILGRDDLRWQIVFCEVLDSAGLHEKNLQNPEGEKSVGDYETGTVLVWKGGKNVPCTTPADHMRMGIAVKGVSSPLVQGAEPVLCTGEVNEGDYLVTSSVEGHAAAISPQYMRQHNLFDCVLGKALEGGNGDSHIIKTWVNI